MRPSGMIRLFAAISAWMKVRLDEESVGCH
jgi:hypothetical protein